MRRGRAGVLSGTKVNHRVNRYHWEQQPKLASPMRLPGSSLPHLAIFTFRLGVLHPTIPTSRVHVGRLENHAYSKQCRHCDEAILVGFLVMPKSIYRMHGWRCVYTADNAAANPISPLSLTHCTSGSPICPMQVIRSQRLRHPHHSPPLETHSSSVHSPFDEGIATARRQGIADPPCCRCSGTARAPCKHMAA